MTKMETQFTKVIVIGMNPSGYPTGSKNRKNHTMDRLNRWASELGLPVFSFSNVYHEPGEFKQKDIDIDTLRDIVEGYDKVLALGGMPSRILNKLKVDHFKLPHPSPRNRLLNSKEYEKSVLDECRKYVRSL